jgi:hypothetical protein
MQLQLTGSGRNGYLCDSVAYNEAEFVEVVLLLLLQQFGVTGVFHSMQTPLTQGLLRQ